MPNSSLPCVRIVYILLRDRGDQLTVIRLFKYIVIGITRGVLVGTLLGFMGKNHAHFNLRLPVSIVEGNGRDFYPFMGKKTESKRAKNYKGCDSLRMIVSIHNSCER